MQVNYGTVLFSCSLSLSPSLLFLSPLSSGVNTVLGPLYISEISPIKYRGAMGTFFQLSVTSTILLSQLLGINAVS